MRYYPDYQFSNRIIAVNIAVILQISHYYWTGVFIIVIYLLGMIW